MNLSKFSLILLSLFWLIVLFFTFTFSQTTDVANAQQASVTGFAQTFTGQGFDACALPQTADMQVWIQDSPYKVVNLYGGPMHACPSGQPTLERVQALMQQGWKFIPTWVGPQSQCWGIVAAASADESAVYVDSRGNAAVIGSTSRIASQTAASRRIYTDTELAYTQGISQADAAIEWAAYAGLTEEDGSQTIIYYDLEHFNDPDGAEGACIQAAQAFINGWSMQMQKRGNLAGLYTTACTLNRYAATTPALDAVWIARFLLPYQYRSDASVFNMPCISDSQWANQQRIVQYAGGHTEGWNGITLTIDSNVIDGIVALGNPAATPLPTRTATATPTATASYTPTATATFTGTLSETPNARSTITGTITGTINPTITGTLTLTPVAIGTETATPTQTPVPTAPSSAFDVFLPLVSRQ